MKGFWRKFTVEGLNVERLLRQAGDAGIRLRSLRRTGKKLHGQVNEADLSALQAMTDAGGWRFSPGERIGAGRLADLLRRRAFLTTICLLAAALVVCASQMMWRVEIISGGSYEADIRQYLTEQNVRPVRWKRSVKPAQLRDALEWRYPAIAWFEVGWRGMGLQIKVFDGVSQGESITAEGSCDVVASRAGIVTGIVTVAGTPMVEIGELVQAGQVLIAGTERTSGDETRPVAARGQIMARVWDGASITMNIMERETVYTGRRQRSCTAALPWFDLSPAEPSGYEQEDTARRTLPLGGLFIPLTMRFENRMEAVVTLKPRDLAQLKAEAGMAAMRKLREKIGIGDDLVDKWVDYSMIDSEVLCALAIGERVIDIAQQQRAP